jgi:aminoglycoside phosphotransferase (APT) family kinase protein
MTLPTIDPVAEFEQHRTEFADWVRNHLEDAADVRLTQFTAASSGFSNLTLFSRLAWRDREGHHDLDVVLRAAPASAALFPDYDLRLQYDVMAALAESPVPIPRVLWYSDGAGRDPAVACDGPLSRPFFLMERVHGDVASGYYPGFHGHGLFFDASVEHRRGMWWGALDAMAGLHRIDPATLTLPRSLAPELTGEEAIRRVIDGVERLLDWATEIGPMPTLRRGIDWLRRELCPPTQTVLCWGDARPGNIIYRDFEVATVLDWELAYLGPPECDLAYFLLLDDVTAEINQQPRLNGLPSSAETVSHYESQLGRAAENMDYYTALQALRVAAMLVLVVKMSPGRLNYADDFLTNNFPTRRLAGLTG